MSASEAADGEARPGLLRRYVPILQWLPSYQRGWFVLDLWTQAGAIDAIGPDHVLETVRTAVQAFDAIPTATAATTSPP